MLKKDIPNGVIIYEGPSILDGAPIVVIANGFKENNNRKVGDMIQTWILRSDMHPNDALKTGSDSSICGDCFHRGEYNSETGLIENNTCYVNLYKQGVYSIYHAYKRGSYPVCDIKHMQLFDGKHVRIGSYGDPAAVPIHVWDTISKLCKDYTGYSHLWRTCDQAYSKYCMASCETVRGYEHANKKKWRTFRLISKHDTIKNINEIPCFAQVTGAHCDKCNYCNGSMSNRKNVTVVFHGINGKEKQYLAKLKKLEAREAEEVKEVKKFVLINS